MSALEIYRKLRTNLPFEPTSGQDATLYSLSDFLNFDEPRSIYLLTGYAGTGKTSLITSIVNTLAGEARKFALLAPTGRAAKVISAYTGKRSHTIHRMIYQSNVDADGNFQFSVRENKSRNAVIIVDEASMIGSDVGVGGKDLLTDLMQFVATGKNCKLLLIGDTAQLPPVGTDLSLAIEPQWLGSKFQFEQSDQSILTEVIRQQADSGILANATYLRNQIQEGSTHIKLNLFPDVVRVSGTELADELSDAYSKYGRDGVILITRSNSRANKFNNQIRLQVLGNDDELVANDQLMVVKNNYHWLKANKQGNDLIANGDMIQVVRVGRATDYNGFRFVDATIRLPEHDVEVDIDVKLWTDCLQAEGPAMSSDDVKTLFGLVRSELDGKSGKQGMRAMLNADPFVNALQVKYGYAVTCHKAQGGQWPAVFIDQGYLTEEMIDRGYLRWLYTALTRASQKVYLINFSDQFIN